MRPCCHFIHKISHSISMSSHLRSSHGEVTNYHLYDNIHMLKFGWFLKDILFNKLGYLRKTNYVKAPFERTKFGLVGPRV